MAAPEDTRWMRVALGLARRRLGRVAPNPAVATLVVGAGRVLGRGVTGEGGRPHSETLALEQARARFGPGALVGATAYVTLEPCAHHGRTPPCAEALAEAAIARVVAPIEDPDPRVSGRGFALLRAAGVAVETGVMDAEARAVNAGFLSLHDRGRPHLTLKLAATLDGRIATAAGESRWITGPAARARVHLMRAEADAVLIGAGTARADDPMLDARGLGREDPQPVRLVADGGLTLPHGGRLARTAREVPAWVLHRADAPAERAAALAALGLRLIEIPAAPDGALEMEAALTRLAELGLTRILCEGGGTLAASLIRAGLVDEIALFQAGRAIGAEGRPAIGPLGLERLGEAPGFRLAGVEAVGPDILSRWHPA